MAKFDPYQLVTDKIIAYMESGKFENLPALWTKTGNSRNAFTGRAYSGINVLLLMIRMDEEGWDKPLFLTFNQVKAVAKKFEKLNKTEMVDGKERTIYPAYVKKGTKGEQVCFWKRIEVKDDESPDEKKIIPILRLYTVFNVNQLEMKSEVREYLERHATLVAKYEIDGKEIGKVETFLSTIGSDVQHGGERAYYSPATDKIGMPHADTFASMVAYYATRFHEEVHKTGHEARLDRDLKNRFGSDAYAFEELVAELGAAFLCADFSINQTEWRHHAEYIRIWVKRMREDKHAIFKSASLANAAVNHLWEMQPEDLRNKDQI
jgi:antirestriction protein ArdC